MPDLQPDIGAIRDEARSQLVQAVTLGLPALMAVGGWLAARRAYREARAAGSPPDDAQGPGSPDEGQQTSPNVAADVEGPSVPDPVVDDG